jgi:lysophospholipase L1-like esterase
MFEEDKGQTRTNWFKRHKISSKFILIILGIVLPLVILEFGSYLLGKFPFEADPLLTERRSSWAELRTFDPQLFWKLKPNINVRTIQTNNLGLRDEEIPDDKGNEFRILSLGESTTFGLWVKQEETYSAVLGERMGSIKEKPLRVINAGIPGYTLFQGYVYLKHRGIDLKPDAVMIYFGHNDFLPVANLRKRDGMASEASQGLNDWELYQQRQAFSWKLSFWLAQRSNFVRAIMSIRNKNANPEVIRAHPNKVRVPREHREKLLKLFREWCEEKDIAFIIIVPWYQTFKKHIALLRKFAAENNVLVVDLPQALKMPLKKKKRFFRDSTHPNPRGHRAIAEAIAVKLRHYRWDDD